MPRAETLLVNVGLLAASIVFAAGAAEVALRVTHYGEAGQIRLTGFMQYDPLLGWRHIPNVTNEWITSEYQVKVHYNGSGWRDSEHSFYKAPDRLRIAVLGDSFAEGLGVAQEDRFSDVLQANVGRRFEVVNLGIAAYSTDQKLLLLENDGWKYDPDIVLLEMDFYDVWGNGLPATAMTMGTEKPAFVVDAAGDLKLTNVPVPKPKRQAVRPTSRLLDLLRRDLRVEEELWHPSGAPPQSLPDSYTVYRNTESPQLHNAWTVTEALLRRAKQDSERHSARLVVFYVPGRVEMSETEWHLWPFTADDDRRRVVEKLASICGSDGIEFIDPSGGLRQAAETAQIYYRQDVHWTPAGHRVAGKLLARYFQNAPTRVSQR